MTRIEHWTLEEVRNVTETREAFENDKIDRPVLAWWTNEHDDQVEYRLNTAPDELLGQVVEVDLSDTDEDGHQNAIDAEIDGYLNALEEQEGYPVEVKSTPDVELSEDGEKATVTIDVALDAPKYQSAAFIPEAAAEEMGLEELDRAEFDLAAAGFIIGEFEAREPARQACVNFLTGRASLEQLGYTVEENDPEENDADEESEPEPEPEPEIPRTVMADRLMDTNTKAELFEKADAEGIEVAKRWTKDEIIEAILDEKEGEMREQLAA